MTNSQGATKNRELKYQTNGETNEKQVMSQVNEISADEITPVADAHPQTSVFIGDTVNLTCEVHQSTGWNFLFTTPFTKTEYVETTGTKTITSVRVSDGGEYKCRARKSDNVNVLTQYSEPITVTVHDKPTLTVQPQMSVFIGDSVTLICEVHQSTGWKFLFITPSNPQSFETSETKTKTIRSVQVSDGGEYKCRARKGENPHLDTQHSEPIRLTVKDVKPKLTVQPQTSVFVGDTVTLICEVHESTGWKFIFINPSNTESTETTGTKTIRSVQVSDGGKYKCRAGRGNPQVYTQHSEPITVTVQSKPTPEVSVWPADHVFRGETVNLRCVINGGGVSSWQYSWYKDSIIQQNKLQYYTIRSVTESDAGKYTCRGTETRGSQYSHISNAVTLTVSDKPQTVLSVSPQQWLTEGDSVTLMCEVINSSTGWTFSWFTVYTGNSLVNKDDYELVSNSSRGVKGIYTVSSVTVKHTGVYMCRAERGDPVYHTDSNTQTLWITGVSPSVSLIIRPNRSQHFSSESLSLSCEDHSNSTGWTVRRYTHKLKPCSSSDTRSTGTTSNCTIRSLNTSDTGVYWCQSESGEKLYPVNISVHNVNVILDSPVHSVTKGDNLTLRCLYRDKKPSNLRAEFYKDGSVVQTTGDMMIIPTVSKSHEGFYYCKHPERGESPKSWISVRGDSQMKTRSFNMITFLLAVSPYLLGTVVLIVKCCRLRGETSL
ncbi:Fc receptor-like protein 5 [Misgurnus anguillicaudatus]|uniref:Fc receptor-like protein 5 n=1 Tax=Misgurnus anguillicaudatus TaxID=75329 RepID=UPI003CCF0676